jgi:hypothetical protein
MYLAIHRFWLNDSTSCTFVIFSFFSWYYSQVTVTSDFEAPFLKVSNEKYSYFYIFSMLFLRYSEKTHNMGGGGGGELVIIFFYSSCITLGV